MLVAANARQLELPSELRGVTSVVKARAGEGRTDPKSDGRDPLRREMPRGIGGCRLLAGHQRNPIVQCQSRESTTPVAPVVQIATDATADESADFETAILPAGVRGDVGEPGADERKARL